MGTAACFFSHFYKKDNSVSSCLLPWMDLSFQKGVYSYKRIISSLGRKFFSLTLLHSEGPKLYGVLALFSAIRLRAKFWPFFSAIGLRVDLYLSKKAKM